MRAITGRKEVAKLIKDIQDIDNPDVLYEHVRDIAYFYTSPYRTGKEILIQHEHDVKDLVDYYNHCKLMYEGHEPQNDLDIRIEPDSSYKQAFINFRDALKFLFREAAAYKVFLKIETLEESGLKDIQIDSFKGMRPVSSEPTDELQRIDPNAFKRITISLYDYIITLYKRYGGIEVLPDIPDDLYNIFLGNKEYYHEFCERCKGKDLRGIALEFDNFENMDKSRAAKPIVRHFYCNRIDPSMSENNVDMYYRRFRRYSGKS